MKTIIDIHGLSERAVKLIQELVELLREKTKIQKAKSEKMKEEVSFASWSLGVKDAITRDEIYKDYLDAKFPNLNKKSNA